ncbi:MAG: protein-methionine-sulfoxide reductase heme-binding subunit MsrQ [Chloroflexota bacterium]
MTAQTLTGKTKARPKRKSQFNWLFYLVHIGALYPLVWFGWQFWQQDFAVIINPFQEATFRTGYAALVLLILSLAATPLNTVFGWKRALTVKKTLGLWGFAYVTLHFLIFVVDNGLFGNTIKIGPILEATFEKRFALVGFAAFVLLIPLAITSTKGWQKRLKKRWKQLHRLAYVAAGLGVLHYAMLVKSDLREPLTYGFILAALLVVRIPRVRKWVTKNRPRFGQRKKKATA